MSAPPLCPTATTGAVDAIAGKHNVYLFNRPDCYNNNNSQGSSSPPPYPPQPSIAAAKQMSTGFLNGFFELRNLIGVHLGEISCVALSLDAKLLVAGSKDRTVSLWSVDTATRLAVMALYTEPGGCCSTVSCGHDDEVTAVAFSQDSTRIISGDAFGTVCIWDAATRKQIAQVAGRKISCTGVAFCALDRNSFFVSHETDDGTVAAFLYNERSKKAEIDGKAVKAANDEVRSIYSVPSPNGTANLIVTTSIDGTTGLFDMKSRREAGCIAMGTEGAFLCSVLSREGRFLFAGTDNGSIFFFEVSNGNIVSAGSKSTVLVGAHKDRVVSTLIAPSRYPHEFISVAADGSIRFWTLAVTPKGAVVVNAAAAPVQLPGSNVRVTKAAINGNGIMVFATEKTGDLHFWKFCGVHAELNPFCEPIKVTSPVASLVFVPGGIQVLDVQGKRKTEQLDGVDGLPTEMPAEAAQQPQQPPVAQPAAQAVVAPPQPQAPQKAPQQPQQQPQKAAAPAAGNLPSYRERLTALYTAREPEKLAFVERNLEKYKGQEEEMFQQLFHKHNRTDEVADILFGHGARRILQQAAQQQQQQHAQIQSPALPQQAPSAPSQEHYQQQRDRGLSAIAVSEIPQQLQQQQLQQQQQQQQVVLASSNPISRQFGGGGSTGGLPPPSPSRFDERGLPDLGLAVAAAVPPKKKCSHCGENPEEVPTVKMGEQRTAVATAAVLQTRLRAVERNNDELHLKVHDLETRLALQEQEHQMRIRELEARVVQAQAQAQAKNPLPSPERSNSKRRNKGKEKHHNSDFDDDDDAEDDAGGEKLSPPYRKTKYNPFAEDHSDFDL